MGNHELKEERMGRFDGRVVLITGGARGQGRSHAVKFAEEDADVRDRDQIDSFVHQAHSELGRVDFLLANAGIFAFSTVAEMSDTAWNDMIGTNLTGVFHAIRAVLPIMIEQNHGRIVATSSMAGKAGFGNIGLHRAQHHPGPVGGAHRHLHHDGVPVLRRGRYITGETIAVAAGQNAANAG
jgi:NAD(P)-dependent dehydrogenase (short-subunit alcohol dehydrogenase family)